MDWFLTFLDFWNSLGFVGGCLESPVRSIYLYIPKISRCLLGRRAIFRPQCICIRLNGKIPACVCEFAGGLHSGDRTIGFYLETINGVAPQAMGGKRFLCFKICRVPRKYRLYCFSEIGQTQGGWCSMVVFYSALIPSLRSVLRTKWLSLTRTRPSLKSQLVEMIVLLELVGIYWNSSDSVRWF